MRFLKQHKLEDRLEAVKKLEEIWIQSKCEIYDSDVINLVFCPLSQVSHYRDQ